MLTFYLLSALCLFLMLIDIYIQKKGNSRLIFTIVPMMIFPTLLFLSVEFETNDMYTWEGFGLLLSVISWIGFTMAYMIQLGNKNQFKYHLYKGLAIALTVGFTLAEIGAYKYLPIAFAGTWIINDLLWNVFNKQKWYYKGDGKGDVFDIYIKTPTQMVLIKIAVLAGALALILF